MANEEPDTTYGLFTEHELPLKFAVRQRLLLLERNPKQVLLT